MSKILIVEDDTALLTIISQRFTEEGYTVTTASSVGEASKKIKSDKYDLAVIDIGLPDGDGFSVAQEINESIEIPFIFLTAMSSPEFRLEGYELGASDYIPKPFHFKELKLRVEKLLGNNRKSKTLSTESFELDPNSFTFTLNGEKPVTLAMREFTLLFALVSNSPNILSRENIIEDIWQAKSDTNQRAVDNCMVKLREYLGEELSKNISSVRGAGYQWLPSD